MKIFKMIHYGLYMIFLRLKGIKLFWVRKIKGEEAADKYVEKVSMDWSKFTVNIIGIDLKIEGLENIPEGNCVFIGNHSSILDIPILIHAAQRTVGLIGKKELVKIPVVGYWMKQNHCIPLDRSNVREAMKVINQGVDYIKQGYTMGVFPEGTRNKDGEVGEFKKGSLKLATKAKAILVPVAIDRASRCFEQDREFKAEEVRVIFCKAIDTKDITKEEEKTLTDRVRAEIVNVLEKN